jgi:sugar phosphate isomerase/epimerase
MKINYHNKIASPSILAIAIFFSLSCSCRNAITKWNLPAKIGVCTKITDDSLLAMAGYSYIEESVQDFLVPLQDDSVFNHKLELLKASRLKVPVCNVFIPGKFKCVGPDADHDEILKYSEIAFRRAAIAGVKIIVFGSGGSRNIPEGFSKEEAKRQFTGLCRKLAPIAEKYSLIIVLEPLNKGECNLINSLAEGAEIVKNINHKNFMLLADVYHMLRDNESPDNIIKYGDIICHTHIAENAGREAPGVANEDFTPYFKALKKINYQGLMSIECRWKNMPEQAAKALQTIRTQVASI